MALLRPKRCICQVESNSGEGGKPPLDPRIRAYGIGIIPSSSSTIPPAWADEGAQPKQPGDPKKDFLQQVERTQGTPRRIVVSSGVIEKKYVTFLSSLLPGLKQRDVRTLLQRIDSVYSLRDISKLKELVSGGTSSNVAVSSARYQNPTKDPVSLCEMTRDIQLFCSGIIEYRYPAGYEPSDPDHEAMYYMWLPHYSESSVRSYEWLDFGTIHSMIGNWKAGYDPGKYPNWKGGWGRNHRALLHMINILYVFRDLIPDGWPSDEIWSMCASSFGFKVCENVKATVEQLAEKAGWLHISGDPDEDLPCPDRSDSQLTTTSDGVCDNYSFTLESPDSSASLPWNGETGDEITRICPSFLQGHTLVADEFLYHGNRAYWAALEGMLCSDADAVSNLVAAMRCGRVAFSALIKPLKTLLHEIVHRSGAGRHCEYYCCQGAISNIWYARTLSYCGAPIVSDGDVDTSFTKTTYSDHSTCHEEHDFEFGIEIEFDSIGNPGDETAFTITCTQEILCDEDGNSIYRIECPVKTGRGEDCGQ